MNCTDENIERKKLYYQLKIQHIGAATIFASATTNHWYNIEAEHYL